MIYNCVSLNIICFTKTDQDHIKHFEDVYSILPGLRVMRQYFIFHLVDIGPYEVFENYNILRELIRSIKAVDFTPRLLTSGRYFKSASETSTWFRELTTLGVTKIVLRLNQTTAESLPKDYIINFVNACGNSGINPDIMFELEDSVPASLYQLLCLVERKRFYTDLYVRIKAKPKLSKFSVGTPIKRLSIRSFRVVVTANADIVLRTRDQGTEEIYLENLRDMPFQEIIDPSRLVKTTKDVIQWC